jgi:DNA repair protein RadC
LESSYIVKEEVEPFLPRERLEKYGEKMLSNQELLAIILGHGTHNETVYSLSQRVLETFENLYYFKMASLEELREIKGIGKVKSVEIKAMIELGRRIDQANTQAGMSVHSSFSLAQKMIIKLKDYQEEHLVVIFLNTKNQIIREKTMFVGSLDQSIAHPREIFREAVKFSAASIIVVHNHPSGNVTPSKNDYEVTERIKKAGDMVGIKLLDHLIVGKKEYFSMREEGKLV